MEIDKKKTGLEEKFYQLCEKVAKSVDLLVYDVEYLAAQHLLRVYICNDQQTADLEDCVKMDRALTPFVEEEEWMPEQLTLEVSSPGVYRSLNYSQHFQTAKDQFVQIAVYGRITASEYPQADKDVLNKNKFRLKLRDFNTTGVDLELNNHKVLNLPFERIKWVKLDPDLIG